MLVLGIRFCFQNNPCKGAPVSKAAFNVGNFVNFVGYQHKYGVFHMGFPQ